MVDGNSMTPSLTHGSYVLVRRTKVIDVDDIVLCRHPFRKDTQIVKRVAHSGQTGVFVVGDNPDASTDSNSFGVVPWVHVIGVVTAQMRG